MKPPIPIKGILFLYILFALLFTDSFAQESAVHRVLTIGNTIDLSNESPVSANLKSIVDSNKTPISIILNGDFSDGSMNLQQDSIRLSRIIEVVKNRDHAQLVIIPGDRDWADSGPKGWKHVIKLEKLVKSFHLKNIKWAIKNACPGPEEIQLGDDVVLIAIQTQWWNHPHSKPSPSDADCSIATQGNFNEELEDLIEANRDKNILIAGHFPLISFLALLCLLCLFYQ